MGNINQGTIDIAICFDANAASEALVAVNSIIHYADRDRSYVVHAFFIDIDREHLRRLSRLAHRNVEIVLHDLATEPDASPAGWPRHIAFARLLLPRLLPQVRKVLYLDVDIVAVTDVAPLFQTPLDGAAVGACIDLGFERRRLADRPVSKAVPGLRAVDYLTRVLGIPDEFHDRYFNAGMLLLDLEQLREMDLVGAAAELLASREAQLVWHDQCLLNALLHRRVKLLDGRWNAMLPADFLALKRDPVSKRIRAIVADAAILHFTGGKPWRLHPRSRATVWWRFALASASAGDLLASAAQQFAKRKPVFGTIVTLAQIAVAWPAAARMRHAGAPLTGNAISSGSRRIVGGLFDEVAALYHASRDPRSPWIARLIAGAVAGYVVSPIDLIPDVIPVVGYLDDVGAVAVGIFVLRRLIPEPVMREHRTRKVSRGNQSGGQGDKYYEKLNWLFGAVALSAWAFMRSMIGH